MSHMDPMHEIDSLICRQPGCEACGQLDSLPVNGQIWRYAHDSVQNRAEVAGTPETQQRPTLDATACSIFGQSELENYFGSPISVEDAERLRSKADGDRAWSGLERTLTELKLCIYRLEKMVDGRRRT